MRILLSGAAGFIGSHLTRALLGRGDDVVAVDNHITGRPDNLMGLPGGDGLTILDHDVAQPIELYGAIDAVMHFASPASPPDYHAHPLATLDAGTLGTRALLELARTHNARFMLASTSEVYGDPLEHPQRETYWGNVNPIGPRSVYDEAKRCAEAYTAAYGRAGVDTTIARIFNTYGERMRFDDGRAIPSFVSQALTGTPLTVYGDGQQTRSLCYIDDLVRGILLLLDSVEHDPINLGSSEEITMLRLAELIVDVVGSKSHIVFRSLPTDDPKQRCPDLTRARDRLGWQPEITLDEGLARTAQWFRDAMHRAV